MAALHAPRGRSYTEVLLCVIAAFSLWCRVSTADDVEANAWAYHPNKVVVDSSTSHVFAGVRITIHLHLEGSNISLDERIRVVPLTTLCGQAGSASSVSSLIHFPLPGDPLAYDANTSVEALDSAGVLEGQLAAEVESSGNATLLWKNLAIIEVGMLRICLCDTAFMEYSSHGCIYDHHFDREVGKIDVKGPTDSQPFTCDAGWPCAFGPLLGDVVYGNRLRVMSSCYPPVQLTNGFLPGVGEGFNGSMTDWILGDPSISLPSSSSYFSWGPTEVLSYGAAYEICWCAAQYEACNRTANFLVRAGSLTVPGPSKTVDVLCTAGRLCHFAFVKGTGVAIGDGDQVMVLPDCRGGENVTVDNWPKDGISDAATHGGHDFWWDASWFNTTGIPTGTNRLCWCYRHRSCSNSDDFRFDAGSITVAGPKGGQSWLCTKGQRCTITNIEGTTLAVDDHYIPSPQCGLMGNATGFRNGRILENYVLPTPSANSSSAGFEWSLVMALPAIYHLCWVPSWQRPSQRSCSDLGWSRLGAGSALTCGQTQFGGGACSADSIANAKATCRGTGARLCLPHEIRQGETSETTCRTLTPSWTAQSCGPSRHVLSGMLGRIEDDDCKQAEQEISGSTQTTLAPVACCADTELVLENVETAAYDEWFNDWQHYQVAAGSVSIRGPFEQDNYCAMGDTCIVISPGVLLNHGTDYLMVVSPENSCGTVAAAHLSQYFTNSKANATMKSSSEEEFNLGQSSKSGIFRMCWCSVGQTSCTQNVDFNVDAGRLLIGGISVHSFKCIYAVNCTVYLNGTNLGGEDSIMLVPNGISCSQATLTDIEDAKASINPAQTHVDDVVNGTFKRFNLGMITKHGEGHICYCIRFGNRVCQDSSGIRLEFFSLSGGIIDVFGPFLNTTLTNGRAGVPYSVQLAGEELSIINRISLQQVDGGPLCGELGSNVSDAVVTVPQQTPSTVNFLASQQAWYGITVSHAGFFRVCWCAGSSPCSQGSDYSLQAAWVFIEGIKPSFTYSDQIVGNPFDLTLFGHSLSPSDRIVVASTSVISNCGDTGTVGAMAGLVQGATGAPVAKDVGGLQGAEEVWRNVAIMAVGSYLICWCGDSSCILDVNFGTQAATLDVTGPNVTSFNNILAGESFEIRLFGSSLGFGDRISIVDSSVSCGTAQADMLASTLVVNGTNATLSHLALQEPESVSAEGQVWTGMMIRWQGLYKLCWAGNYSVSRRCETFNVAAGNCSEYESAHYPFHVGDIQVVHGNASIIGESHIARCDTLDVMAFSPSLARGNDSALDALVASWACTPRGELCDTLGPDLLSQSGKLHIFITAQLLADMLDRAEWVAQGLGLDKPVQSFTLAVDMIDTHNVTRYASLTFSVSNLVPLVQGVPAMVNTTIAEELHLQVYIQYPGGVSCSALPPKPINSILWRSMNNPSLDLMAGSSGIMYDLLMRSEDVALLGVGVHNISAHVDFGGAFPAQEVFFLVHLLSAPVPSISMLAPSSLRYDCPAVFLASSLEETFYATTALSYNWSCPDCTSALAATSGEWQMIQNGSLSVGSYTPAIVANVSSTIGASVSSQADVSVTAAGVGSWPFLPLPLPQAVRKGLQVTCGVVTGTGANASCMPPLDASWSLVELPGNTETQLTTERSEFNIGSQVALGLQATFSTSALVAGRHYRCALRASGSILHSTNAMLVASPPFGGRVVVAPITGVALSTRFTLTSEDWISDNLPLMYAFAAMLASTHSGLTSNASIDAGSFLRGWDIDDAFSCILGQAGDLDIAVEVQDALGATGIASSRIAVQSPTLPINFDVQAIAQWPPNARSLTVAASQLVIAASGGDASVANLDAVSPLLDGLWNASKLSSLSNLRQNDLALRGWVLVHTLYLAGTEGPGFDQCSTAARVLERSAAQAAALTTMGTRKTIELEAVAHFLIAAASVSYAMVNFTNNPSPNNSQQVADEVMTLLRGFEQQIGEAMVLRMRRNRKVFGDNSSNWEDAAGGNMSVHVGQITRTEALTGMNYTHGLRIQVASTVGGRRLSASTSYLATQQALTGSCTPNTAEVQLTFWNRMSPLSADPFAQQVSFEGSLTGLQATWSVGGGTIDPHVATVRLWFCPEGLQNVPGITVKFGISRGPASFVDVVRNYSLGMVQTYHVNITWLCAQWDSSLGQWRAMSDMIGASNIASMDCTSRLPASIGPVHLMAFPGANTTLHSQAPIATPQDEDDRLRFKGENLWPLLIAALVLQVPLIVLCILDAWDPAKRDGEDMPAAGRNPSALDPPRPSCVLVPALSFFEGLWRLHELKCCTWCRCGRRSRMIQQQQQQLPPMEVVTFVPSSDDEAKCLKTEPALRPTVEQAAKNGLNESKEAREAKGIGVQRHGYTLCWGCCRRNARVSLQRKLLMKSLTAYRNLLLNSFQHKALIQEQAGLSLGSSPRREHTSQTHDVKKLLTECDTGVDAADEPFVLRVAHHVQEYLAEIGLSNEGIRLSATEDLSVKCCQRALAHTMFSLAENRARPTTSGTYKPQPFFAPPCANRFQLTSMETIILPQKKKRQKSAFSKVSKATTKVIKVTPESSQPQMLSSQESSQPQMMSSQPQMMSSVPSGVVANPSVAKMPSEASMVVNTSVVPGHLGTKKQVVPPPTLNLSVSSASAPTTSGSSFQPGSLTGILPQPSKAWSDPSQEEAPLPDLEIESSQKYLVGCDYYLWANGKTLFIHRAETLMTNHQKAPAPLDQSLASHETTWAFDLERDVSEIALCPGDDRFVILNLRGGRSLRWQIDGEIKAWVDSVKVHIAAVTMHVNEILHCWQPSMQGENSSCFFYNLRELPPLACNVFFDTVSGRVAPGHLWYSHGGATISFAMRIESATLQEDDLDMIMKPTVSDSPGTIQVVGAYLADIVSFRHLTISGAPVSSATAAASQSAPDAQLSRFCLELIMLNGTRLRICFGSRFQRLTCQCSINRLRQLVQPGSSLIPVGLQVVRPDLFGAIPSRGEDILNQRDRPVALNGFSAMVEKEDNDVSLPFLAKPPWHGLRGILEVKIFSASRLGLVDADGGQSAELLKAGKMGRKKQMEAVAAAKQPMPCPKLCGFFATQAPPQRMESRRTPDLPERTANPIWNNTWHFTVEYSEDDAPPADIRFEMYNVDGRNEFLGEITVPFPLENCTVQYHKPLKKRPDKMQDATKEVEGTVSFQLGMKIEETDGLRPMTASTNIPKHIPVMPDDFTCVCGTVGVEIVRAIGLRTADLLSSDPYVSVLVPSAPRQMSSWRTATRFGTLNPIWRETHEFCINWPNGEIEKESAQVKMEIWDHDAVSSDEFLGEISFGLPYADGENLIDLEVQPNHKKGPNTVKGRLQARVWFVNQFKAQADTRNTLDTYEKSFCDYFGNEHVDDQLARTIAPPLIFFHLSATRIFFSQFRDAWKRASCGLLAGKASRGTKTRVACYLELISALTFGIGLAAMFLHFWHKTWVSALVGGTGAAVLSIDPAKVLAAFLWHRPAPPLLIGRAGLGGDGWASSPAGCDEAALIISLLGIGAFLALEPEEKAVELLPLAAGVLLVSWLLIFPLFRGLRLTMFLLHARVSARHDWILRLFPSIMTGHGALIQRMGFVDF